MLGADPAKRPRWDSRPQPGKCEMHDRNAHPLSAPKGSSFSGAWEFPPQEPPGAPDVYTDTLCWHGNNGQAPAGSPHAKACRPGLGGLGRRRTTTPGDPDERSPLGGGCLSREAPRASDQRALGYALAAPLVLCVWVVVGNAFCLSQVSGDWNRGSPGCLGCWRPSLSWD